MSLTVEDFFTTLKRRLPDYEDRRVQLEVSKAIYRTITTQGRHLIEAGTGTGKSFAYLIPLIVAKKRAIVSTATITLQEQLTKKDLQFLRGLGLVSFDFALLKGKNNYLCWKRFNEFGNLHHQKGDFRDWLNSTKTGDRDELAYIPEFWSQVAGDSIDCAGKRCPYYNRCFYYLHYRTLQSADIVVVNHYLLAFDLLSEGSILPHHEVLVVDEAHQIDDALSTSVGLSITPFRIKWLLNRLRSLKFAVDEPYEAVDRLFEAKTLFGENLNCLCPVPEEVIVRLRNFSKLLSLTMVIKRLKKQLDNTPEEDTALYDKLSTTLRYCEALHSDINSFLDQKSNDMVYFIQRGKQGFEFQSRLIDTAHVFNRLIDLYSSTVMTSATLKTSKGFDYIRQRLGITDFDELTVDSPFDYQRQSALFIDSTVSTPDRDAEFLRDATERIERLIRASKGRALVLFTSYRHLNYVAERLSLPYPTASQGDEPNSKLLEWFKTTPNSVLLATQSFWQGIDVKGDKLSLLIIVKIPFRPPGDPVYDARCSRLKDRWFEDLALPSAILLIRQAFGRLIRSASDRGVVAILDSRVNNSSYGKQILNSLPKMTVLKDIDEVERFFNEINTQEVQIPSG